MIKFAIVCGALVLGSASVFAQSRDQSDSKSHDRSQTSSRSDNRSSRPSESTRSRGSDTVRRDPPRRGTGSTVHDPVMTGAPIFYTPSRNRTPSNDRGFGSSPISRDPGSSNRYDSGPSRRPVSEGGWNTSGEGTMTKRPPLYSGGGSPIQTTGGGDGLIHKRPPVFSGGGGGGVGTGTPIQTSGGGDGLIHKRPPVFPGGGAGTGSPIQNPGGGDGLIHKRPPVFPGGGAGTGSPIQNPGGGDGLIHKRPPVFPGGGDQGVDGRHWHDHDPIYWAPSRICDIPDWDGHHDGLFISFGGDNYRCGYVYYNDYYRNPRWHYDAYYYEPSAVCVVSPFYYYPELPPYLNVSCVTYGGYFPLESSFYTTYAYRYPGVDGFRRGWSDDPYSTSGSSYNYNEDRYGDRTTFDRAVDNIVDAFADSDARFIENLIPSSGSVAIAQDGYVRYSIGANDFANMYKDLIEATRSRGYEITDVRVYDDNSARVTARHTKVDANGNLTSVYHQYILAYEAHRFVIRKFGVSNNPY